MSSRGTAAKLGYASDTEYETIMIIGDIKVLRGTGNNHSLPEVSHSPNSVYGKLDDDGTLKEIRIFNEKCELVVELGYHTESNLCEKGHRNDKILHIHEYKTPLDRKKPRLLTDEEKIKYEKYIKELINKNDD